MNADIDTFRLNPDVLPHDAAMAREDRKVTRVPCPWPPCSAPAGQECHVDVDGGIRLRRPHPSRIDRARALA